MGRELTQDPASHGLTDEDIIHIPGLLSRSVRLENGAIARYVTSGETGPAVILLHGGIEGSSGTAGWRFMAPFLGKNGFRVYAPDRPGFGQSDTSKAEYLRNDAYAQVEFVRMFADALCLDKFFISGNSAGCTVSCNTVITHPDRILGVAFIAGGLGDIVEAERVPPAKGRFTKNPGYVSPGFDGTNDSMRILMEGIIYEAKAIWPELIEMRVIAANKQREARARFGVERSSQASADPNQRQLFSTKNRLDKLTVPMIYMYGLADVLLPVENGFNQEDATPNIQFFYPDHCGHQGQTDQPDMFNQVFAEFFRDGKVSWKTAEWAGVSRRRAINPDRVEAPAGGFPPPIPAAYKDLQTLRAAIGEMAAAPA
jgi:pimeloyl-ACP methyl ester carboxylesterase